MKILWHSNAPWAQTGYGNQTQLFTKRIQALGHEIAISAFYGLEGNIINWNGIQVYPRGGAPYGDDVIASHSLNFGADISITLIDAWVYDAEKWGNDVRWVPWFPVDMEPIPPPVVKSVTQAHKRIVYSRFAEKQVHNTGLDCYYIPHGIDTSIFRPMDREQCREKSGFPQDRFVVGVVGANKGQPPRKAWVETFAAFGELKKKHDDVMMYCHTNPTTQNGGVDMIQVSKMFGLEINKDVFFPNIYRMLVGGYSDQNMAELYNCLDVHLLASAGEGFGIPIVEAQACGCPVIVGDWTAMSELCFGGWKIPRNKAFPFYSPIGSFQFYPEAGAVYDALSAAYNKRGNQVYRDRAYKGAVEYDVDLVTEKYWKPVLAEIEAGL